MKLAKSAREIEVDAMIASMKKTTKALLSSKEKARDFLVKYGYITRSGRLTKRYGG